MPVIVQTWKVYILLLQLAVERAQAKKARDVETDWARLWFGRK